MNTPVPHLFGGVNATAINSGQPNVTNVTVTGSCTVVVPDDGTNISWKVFAENNNIRCLPQYYGTCTNVPTVSSGYLLIGGATGTTLESFPLTDPTDELDCVATGSSAAVSVLINKRE